MREVMYGFILYVFLLIPPVRVMLESIMITHMLVQLPLLILSGWLVGGYFIKRFQAFFVAWNGNGIPGILLVILITMYWMVPRTLDEALNVWVVELFKFISLPFMVGVPLRDSWKQLTSLGRSFVIFNYLPMFGLMAWLYIDAPVRICNNYLEAEQKVLGWGFLTLTACIVLYTLQRVFTDQSEGV